MANSGIDLPYRAPFFFSAAHNVSPAVSTSSLGKASTVSEECEYFFDVNCCSENNDTALTLAAAGGHLDLVILLLKRGANLEHKDKKGGRSFS